MADRELGVALIALARNAIGARFGVAALAVAHQAALERDGATFVTLMLQGELRGCVGSIESRRPLSADVSANAVAAAFGDPRFPPLAGHELPATSVEVSLLSPAQAFVVADEADLARQLCPGIDGIVLQYEHRRATFLPQVWETLPEPRDFVAALKVKAGMRKDFWAPGVNVARYTVIKWKERDLVAESART